MLDMWQHVILIDDAQSEFTVPRDLKHHSEPYNAALVKLACGGIAGAISRTCTAPIDRIKTIMQASSGNATVAQTFHQIKAENGFRAFFRGNGTNCIKIAPETGAVCVSQSKKLI